MPVRMLKKDEDTKREKGLKKSKMLSGGQVKLDKNKDGKISCEDFKMMKRKRGGSTPGLKNYVKKSDSQEKLIKAINKKTGQAVFVSRKEILADGDSYRPVESGIKNFVSEYARQKSKERKERFSESDKERAEKMMKRKGGGSAISKEKRKRGAPTRKNPNSPKGQNPISEYDRKGKLKYTAANKGAMMNKSTRGYGAARTSGMGLQDEQVKPGKVKPVKAVLGIAAMGLLGAKYLKKKNKKVSPLVGGAAELMKKKKEMLGMKSGGSIGGSLGGSGKLLGKKGKPLAPGNMMNKERLAKLKQQLNRFKNRSTKGGGADESKRMSDKTKQSIQNLVKRIGRLTPTGRAGSDAGKILKEKLKKKIMTPAKKMGGGMIEKLMANKKSFANPISPVTMPQDRKNQTTGPVLMPYDRKNQTTGPMLRHRDKMGGGMMKKQYNKGGSVTASCKLGRNKATKLY